MKIFTYFTFFVNGLLILLSNNLLNAQNRLIGVVDYQLVEINPQNASLTIIAPLSQRYNNPLIPMDYNTSECRFYAIANHATSSPKLIRFDFTGQVTEIGTLTYQGNPIQLTESLAYNAQDDKMYVGASIIGGFDYISESLLEVNLTNATCTLAGRINEAEGDGDLDAMTFFNGQIIHSDAAPNPPITFTYVFKYDLAAIQNSTLVNSIYHNTEYIRIVDLAALDGFIYYTVNRQLFRADPNNFQPQLVGTTHSAADFNGQMLDAIAPVPVQKINLGEDITVCQGTNAELRLDVPNASVLWNNGSTSNPLIINTPGEFWARGISENCPFFTDTIKVDFFDPSTIMLSDTISCDGTPITIALNLSDSVVTWSDGTSGASITIAEAGAYWANLQLGQCNTTTDTFQVSITQPLRESFLKDTSICGNGEVTLGLPDSLNILSWNTGATSNNLLVNQTGNYWASYQIGECIFQTDTAMVEFIDFDPAIGNDTTLCLDATLSILVNASNANILWNNGSTNNPLTVNEAGAYAAQVQIVDCEFVTDTIQVEFIDCPECDADKNYMIPNAFSPNGDGVNDTFAMLFQEDVCQPLRVHTWVFNRWGNLVFETDNNVPWDGTHNGKIAPMDVYVYVVEIIMQSPESEQQVLKKGDITLIR
ncbi:MAG: gliding motility-associated C-terminal domain-containing protein [Saprospiraceae bacterium]|nr:gliding motility-associated C-terminal domain-containing protein [Saprospiraceae bacterium]